MEKIWKGIREIFMSPKAKEEKKRRKEKIKQEENVLNEHLESMDNDWNSEHPLDPPNYDEIIPDKLGLKKKEYDTTSEEDIRNVANIKVSPKYDDAKDRKNREYEKKRSNAMQDIDDIEDKRVKDLIGIKDEYKKKSNRERNKNHRNGILKSSISELASKDIRDERNRNMEDVYSDAEDAIAGKKKDIETLGRERDEAIASLDLKKASAIDEEIDRRLKAKTKYNDDVTRYNNDVDTKENNYAIKRRESINSLNKSFRDDERAEANHEQYHGYTGAKKKHYMKRYELAWNFYNSLPRDEAVEAITNNVKLKEYLGLYYPKLIAEQSSRNG